MDPVRAIKGIPSATRTSIQEQEEEKLNTVTRRRLSEISRQFNEQRRTSLTEGPSKPKAHAKTKQTAKEEEVVDGRAVLRLCAELTVDQLCCHYNRNYKLFACGGIDGVVTVFNVKDGEFVAHLLGGKETTGQTACVTSIQQKPLSRDSPDDDCFFCTYVNGIIKCFNHETKECLCTIKEKRQTYGLTFHPRMSKFITYGDDLKIYMYDNETLTKEREFEGSMSRDVHDGPSSRVFAARFYPLSYTEFLTGGWDDTVLLWDIREQHATRYISGVHLCGDGLDIDKAGNEVLTCSWRKENQIQLWDYSTFKPISTLLPDELTSKLYCGCFTDPDFLVCGGGDPSIFRVVEKKREKSKAMVTHLAADVVHMNVGKSKSASTRALPMLDDADEMEPDITKVPKILFTAGKKIYEVDFY